MITPDHFYNLICGLQNEGIITISFKLRDNLSVEQFMPWRCNIVRRGFRIVGCPPYKKKTKQTKTKQKTKHL
jgi:hypothetical protein